MSDVAVNTASSLSNARRSYTVFVLMLVGTMNLFDRNVLTILLEPIRKELSLSDTQIGFITGIAFAAVYVSFAIPVARIADSWSRRKVIAIAISTWSVMTIFCGMAQNFVQLFLARMGVGLGEAGGSAPCHAIISDMFRREVRVTAQAFYLLSVPLGIALGLLWGGWAVGEFGWRWAFMLAGVPGLILGPLVLFTLPEVRSGLADGVKSERPKAPFWQTIRLLLSIGAFRNMMIAAAFQNFLALGVQAWVPSFLVRSHGMEPHQIGTSLAIAFGIPYAIGALLGGRLLDFMGARDLRWHFWIASFTVLVAGAMATGVFSAPTAYVFYFMAVQQFFVSLWAAPMMAIGQSLAPVAFRATTAAFLLFVVNLIGIGLGPQAIGIVSDLLRAAYGEESLRIALLSAAALCIPISFFFFRASVTYRADMTAAEMRNKVANAA